MSNWRRQADGARYKPDHPDPRKATRLITHAGGRGYRCYAGSHRVGTEWKPELVGVIVDESTAERWLAGENVGPALEAPTRVRRERTGLRARLFGR